MTDTTSTTTDATDTPDGCPCGSGKPLADCCEPLHRGERKAETAEELMRSRYSAFVVGNVDYVMQTHHPRTVKQIDRKGVEAWSKESDWKGLEVVSTEAGGKNDDQGIVEFIARFNVRGHQQIHHERAEFEREDGRWYFVDGVQIGNEPVRREGPRVGRNDPCPCGSGKKYKKCCGKAA